MNKKFKTIVLIFISICFAGILIFTTKIISKKENEEHIITQPPLSQENTTTIKSSEVNKNREEIEIYIPPEGYDKMSFGGTTLKLPSEYTESTELLKEFEGYMLGDSNEGMAMFYAGGSNISDGQTSGFSGGSYFYSYGFGLSNSQKEPYAAASMLISDGKIIYMSVFATSETNPTECDDIDYLGIHPGVNISKEKLKELFPESSGFEITETTEERSLPEYKITYEDTYFCTVKINGKNKVVSFSIGLTGIDNYEKIFTNEIFADD